MMQATQSSLYNSSVLLMELLSCRLKKVALFAVKLSLSRQFDSTQRKHAQTSAVMLCVESPTKKGLSLNVENVEKSSLCQSVISKGAFFVPTNVETKTRNTWMKYRKELSVHKTQCGPEEGRFIQMAMFSYAQLITLFRLAVTFLNTDLLQKMRFGLLIQGIRFFVTLKAFLFCLHTLTFTTSTKTSRTTESTTWLFVRLLLTGLFMKEPRSGQMKFGQSRMQQTMQLKEQSFTAALDALIFLQRKPQKKEGRSMQCIAHALVT